MKSNYILSILFLSIFLTSCSTTTTPIIYPNETYQKAGAVQVDVDRKYCIALAENYVKQPNRFGNAAKETVFSAGLGAGTGAIGGAILNNGQIGRTTAAGAAISSIFSIVSELRKGGQTSPSYQRFVEHCLQKKGYVITGWQ